MGKGGVKSPWVAPAAHEPATIRLRWMQGAASNGSLAGDAGAPEAASKRAAKNQCPGPQAASIMDGSHERWVTGCDPALS